MTKYAELSEHEQLAWAVSENDHTPPEEVCASLGVNPPEAFHVAEVRARTLLLLARPEAERAASITAELTPQEERALDVVMTAWLDGYLAGLRRTHNAHQEVSE